MPSPGFPRESLAIVCHVATESFHVRLLLWTIGLRKGMGWLAENQFREKPVLPVSCMINMQNGLCTEGFMFCTCKHGGSEKQSDLPKDTVQKVVIGSVLHIC